MSTPPYDPDALARAAAARAALEKPGELQKRTQLREKYQRAINRLWQPQTPCPICGTNLWTVADVVEVPIRNVSADLAFALATNRQGYVYVPVGCTNCGYTMFFHSGVLDQRAEDET
jgi:predicted nucleic-acid-binding Zn-ribbon protein